MGVILDSCLVTCRQPLMPESPVYLQVGLFLRPGLGFSSLSSLLFLFAWLNHPCLFIFVFLLAPEVLLDYLRPTRTTYNNHPTYPSIQSHPSTYSCEDDLSIEIQSNQPNQSNHWPPMSSNDLLWPPMTFNDLQWPPMTSKDIRWPLMTSNDLQWLPMTSNDLQWPFFWLFLDLSGSFWLFLDLSVYFWIFLSISGSFYFFLFLALSGYFWLYLAISGYFWLFLAISD